MKWRRGAGVDTPVLRKYRVFKRLLDRNRDALGVMADLEQAYYGGRVTSLMELTSRYEKLSASVQELVLDLQELAGGGYADLGHVLEAIGREVAPLLRREGSTAGDLVVSLESLTPAASEIAGGKAVRLAAIAKLAGVSIPRGFVVTTSGFQSFVRRTGLEKPIEDALSGVTGDDPAAASAAALVIRPLILGAPVPEELASRILAAFDELRRTSSGEIQVAMRSSAVGEDTDASFAGQYTTVLGVGRDGLLDAYRSVLASKFSPGAILYRLRFGLDDGDTPMAVLAMKMIDARTSGVLYTSDPLDEGGGAVMKIAATWGLGERLVSGEGAQDVFHVDRETGDVLRREIHEKRNHLALSAGGGVLLVATAGGDARRACLDDEALGAIARLGLALEERFGSPQDVEWSVDQEGSLHVLQSRPLSLTAHPPASTVEPEDPARHPVLLRGGATASAGTASGRVFVLQGRPPDDLPADTILVARAASPEHAALIGKVRGIVADMGGAASHLACVAREFGVPAIFDATRATSTLRQGEAVTIVADTATVYQGVVPELARAERPLRKRVFESPTHRRLRALLDHVAPLNLTDPAKPSFSAAGCRTVHDVIRFAHEQAMREMFGLSRERSGGLATVKMKAQVPLSLHLIDLGGGLRRRDDGARSVTPDEVQSRPMKALWRGFCHPGISWSGSIRADTGNVLRLMSAAAVSDSSELVGGDSYALVAADYLNLSARFGYHFAYLDALCTEVPSQNYVSLQFSGGVGSYYGKSLRLAFLAAVLERLGFRAAITGDVLDAQLVGYDAPAAEETLDQVARLLASSRLLDMAISHQGQVEPMVEAFFKGDYDFLGEGLTRRLPGFYTNTGDWKHVEEEGRDIVVQDGSEWGAGLTSGFTRLMRKVVGGSKYQELLDNVQAYFHFPKAIAKGSAVTEATLTLRVRPMAGVIDQAGGLAFAVRNMGNYFVLRLNALEDNVILFEFVNGTRYQRAAVSRRIERGRWYSLSAEVRGPSVKGYLDGEPLIDFRADRTLEGYVGLWTKADSVTHFSDLGIQRLHGEKETTRAAP